MEQYKLTGITFKLIPHGDFDKTVIIFSREVGVTHLLAKGVRRMGSRRGFHLDILSDVTLEVEKSGGVPYLREASTSHQFENIKSAPDPFAAACCIVSFVMRMLPREVRCPELFSITHDAFKALGPSADYRSVLLTYFLKSLRNLGHIPDKFPKRSAREIVWKAIQEVDPSFTRTAERTLGMFSS